MRVVYQKTLKYCTGNPYQNHQRTVNIMIDAEKDMKFITDIMSQICNYAIENDMKPTETLKTVANNILMITEISNFDGWGSKDGDTK